MNPALDSQSSVNRVGLRPQSLVSPSDPMTGRVPLVLDNPPNPVNLRDGGMNERLPVPAPTLGGGNFTASGEATMP